MVFGYVDDFLEKHAGPSRPHFLATSIWIPISITVVYFLIVRKLGPWFMRNRKPYDVKKFIMAFDLFQIIANFALTVKSIQTFPQLEGSISCIEVDTSDSEVANIYHQLSGLYYMLKLSDLLDTIFFILKKSYHQASYLHVYHHMVMVIFTWYGLKFVPGGHSIFIGTANAIVHTVMYTYYFLSAYDPKYKRHNITMKKIVTQLQMVQFLFVFLIYLPTLRPSCGYSKFMGYVIVLQAMYFLYLFSKFYYVTYIRNQKDKKH